ncbi:MAG: hypothetical protein ACI8QZ_001911 [Chlamydiales bacterium]|jgi:hypothetical protein
MDDYRSRPGDEEVEPLFAGLGVSENQAGSVPPQRRRVWAWLVVLVAGAAISIWSLS